MTYLPEGARKVPAGSPSRGAPDTCPGLPLKGSARGGQVPGRLWPRPALEKSGQLELDLAAPTDRLAVTPAQVEVFD